MEQEYYTLNQEPKAIWLLKFQLKIMMEQNVIFLQQELYYLSCMLEILHSKKLCQTILIINLLNKKNLIPFGKLILEEDLLVILVKHFKIYSAEWLHTTQLKDLKYNKQLHINGYQVKFVLIHKLKNNLIKDKKNLIKFYNKEEKINKNKNKKI